LGGFEFGRQLLGQWRQPDDEHHVRAGGRNADRQLERRHRRNRARLDRRLHADRVRYGADQLALHEFLHHDGGYQGREVRPFWLLLSGWLRRAHLSWGVRVFPGVRRDPERPGELVVDRRIARWFTVEILHLFGYRWRAREGKHVRFVRRRDRR
jgi:hypothetical protein